MFEIPIFVTNEDKARELVVSSSRQRTFIDGYEVSYQTHNFIIAACSHREFFLWVPKSIGYELGVVLWNAKSSLRPNGEIQYLYELYNWCCFRFRNIILADLAGLLRYNNSIYFDVECRLVKC